MADPEDTVGASSGLEMLNDHILKQILEAKDGERSRFESFWERDDQDVDEFTEEEIQNDPQKRILWAAENNKLEDVVKLLTENASLIGSTDKDGYTPLHRAAYNDHLEMSRLLISNGADVLARTEDGWQPLHSACRWNCVRVAELLLHNGADINSHSNGGLTPLHLACSEPDNTDVVELLLLHPGVDVNVESHAGQTPVQVAQHSQVLFHLFRVADPCVNELYPAGV